MNELPFHLALNPFVNEAVSADRETDEARPNDEVDTADTAPLVPHSRPESDPIERPPVVVVEVTARVPVAVIFAPVIFPEKYPLPETSNLFEGEVVPIPTLVELTVNVGVAVKPTWKVEAVELVKPLPRATAM